MNLPDMPRRSRPMGRNLPTKLCLWECGAKERGEADTALHVPDAQGVVFKMHVEEDGAPDAAISLATSLSAKVHEVKQKGLSPWLYLTREILDLNRRAPGRVGRLLSQKTPGSPQTTDIVDYADLNCQKADRRLVCELRLQLPEVEGFLIDPALDLSVFSEDQIYYSPGFRREFIDRHRYDPQVRISEADYRLRRDYRITWEDLLFRLHGSLCHAIEQSWSREIPIVYRHYHRTSQFIPNPWRMALAANAGAAVDCDELQEGAALADAFALSLKRYHPRHRSWRMYGDTTIAAVVSEDLPAVDVAIVCNWDALAAMEAPMRQAFFRSLASLSYVLTGSGLTFHFLSPDLITTADEPTEAGGFRRPEAEYRCIVYPYGWLLRQVDWEILEAFGSQGGKIIYYGPAPQLTLEREEIRDAFEQLMGTKVAPWNEGRQSSLCFEYAGAHFQSSPDTAGTVFSMECESPFVTAEGRAIAARRDNAVYLSFDAGAMTPGLMVLLVREFVKDTPTS